MKDLTPRDGANIPKRENLSPAEKRVADEIERLTKSEAAAFAVLAQAMAGTQAACEDSHDLLRDIKDVLVKVCEHFAIPLPASIKLAMEQKTYDPDELVSDEDDEDEEEDAPA